MAYTRRYPDYHKRGLRNMRMGKRSIYEHMKSIPMEQIIITLTYHQYCLQNNIGHIIIVLIVLFVYMNGFDK